MSDAILARLDRIETMLTQLMRGERPSFDPKITWLPKEADPTWKDKMFSEAPSGLLMLLAAAYEKFAEKSAAEDKKLSNGKPKADWDRKLATAARNWARWNQVAEPKAIQPETDKLPF